MFLNTGIDRGHPSFAGKTVTETFLDGAVDETGGGVLLFRYGGRKRRGGPEDRGPGPSPHGVAWGADIAMFAIPTNRVSGPSTRPRRLSAWPSRDPDDASRFERILSWRDGGPEGGHPEHGRGHAGA